MLVNLLHLVWWSPVASLLLQMVLFHSFKRLHNIPSYVNATHLLIHSSVSGYSGYFCVLVIVNSTSVNTGVQESFWTTVFPGVGLLDHMVALFSTSSPAFTVCRFFDDRHSGSYEVISHCNIDLHFSKNWRCWASFHVPIGHLYVFGEMSI